MVRMPAFGLDGPWRDRVGFAQTMEQITGMAWLTGFADGPPVMPRGPCDPLAGLHALVALLVALEHRARTGRGQLVEATMVEAALNAAAEMVLEHGAYGARLTRDGNRGPVGAPQNLYACRGDDRWLALAVDRRRAVARAASTCMGDPRGRATPRSPRPPAAAPRTTASTRRSPRGAPSATPTTLAEELLARGIPAAPVVPAARARRQSRSFARAASSRPSPIRSSARTRYPTLPLRLAARIARAGIARPAPTLGEHTEEVLRDLLGLDDAEIARLRADGIIGERPLGT